MNKEYEMLIFIKELGRLINDYNKCKEGHIRQQIHKDIVLLGRVIHPGNEKQVI